MKNFKLIAAILGACTAIAAISVAVYKLCEIKKEKELTLDYEDDYEDDEDCFGEYEKVETILDED